jgi:hypothetical protein
MSFSPRGTATIAIPTQLPTGREFRGNAEARTLWAARIGGGALLFLLGTGCSSEPAPPDAGKPDGAVSGDPAIPDAAGDHSLADGVAPDVTSPDVSADAADRDPPFDRASDPASDERAADASLDGATIDASSADAGAASDVLFDAPLSDTTAVDAGMDPPMRCNGYPELCDRRLDEVVFPTTHNAMSNSDEGWIAPNQQHGIKRQLEDGIRGMLIDTHAYMGTTYLCHSSCLLGNRSLVLALGDMKTFLEANPHEVLTLIIENHVSASETETAFVASGLAGLTYVHPAGGAWPTLRTMIASGRRVVVGSETDLPPPAWYHNFYSLAWDTPYSFKTPSEFSCRENRGKRANALFLMNHWIENPLPDENLSRMANARDVLLNRARQCQMESGKLPNFVAVSHYAVGDLFAVVRELNGL